MKKSGNTTTQDGNMHFGAERQRERKREARYNSLLHPDAQNRGKVVITTEQITAWQQASEIQMVQMLWMLDVCHGSLTQDVNLLMSPSSIHRRACTSGPTQHLHRFLFMQHIQDHPRYERLLTQSFSAFLIGLCITEANAEARSGAWRSRS